MSNLPPPSYAPAVAAALAPERLNELGPGEPNRAMRPQLQALTAETLVAPHRLGDRKMAAACLAALWLRHDFADESHSISQEIDSVEGSYWHGILHRREPDYDNAKYWFRRVGRREIFEPLREAAATLARPSDLDAAKFLTTQAAWDPMQFIDLCQAAAEHDAAPASDQSDGARLARLCRQIQAREWELLFDHSFRAATATR